SLRAFHFFDEQDRVSELAKAAAERRFDRALAIMNASGESSWKLLQNIRPDGREREQPLALALYLTRSFLDRHGEVGACRVHGGGFAGTILAAIPTDHLDEYRRTMTGVFGERSVMELAIREAGVIAATL
ncbi:MAG: galactokinase, partial [Spirochaetales bacterium]|nr:galactokinase [Spirochaetales bacterium]